MYRITNGIYMSSSSYRKFLVNIQRNVTLKKEKKNTIKVKKSWIPGDVEIRKKTWAARK